MIKISTMGESTVHEADFLVDRPFGNKEYLVILVQTPSYFFIEGEWREYEPGYAVVFKPGQKQLYCANGANYIDSWIYYSDDSGILGDGFPFGLPIKLYNEMQFHQLFHLIHSTFYSVSENREPLLDNLTATLLYKLADENSVKNMPDICREVHTVREMIYREPQRQWSISGIAEELHISSGYFQKIYKSLFGISCINDVINSRIESACELLTSGNYTVERVGELCGYNNSEHFIRQFKSKTGQTPHQYRKLRRMNMG